VGLSGAAEGEVGRRGKWHYLYRAVDKHGKTVDFLLRPDRGIASNFVRSQPAARALPNSRDAQSRALPNHVTKHPTEVSLVTEPTLQGDL
jgi:hypothetical protein